MSVRFLVLTSFLWTLGAPAGTVTVSTADGRGADSYVQGTDKPSPNEINFGLSGNMMVKNSGVVNHYARKPYIRFDTSVLQGPIAAVTLDLTVHSNNLGSDKPTTPTSFTVDVFGLKNESLDEWLEGDGGTGNSPPGEIRWSNAPGNDISSGNAFLDSDTVKLGTIDVTPSDVTSRHVQLVGGPAFVNLINDDTNGLVTVMLRRSGSNPSNHNNLSFYTKEATRGNSSDIPMLKMIPISLRKMDVPEEPTVTVLIQSAGGAAIALREVEVFVGDHNVASSGQASQSATLAGHPATLANDGKRTGKGSSRTHASTQKIAKPTWWKLDLAFPSQVERLILHGDEQGGALGGARVRLLGEGGKVLWQTIIPPSAGSVIGFER